MGASHYRTIFVVILIVGELFTAITTNIRKRLTIESNFIVCVYDHRYVYLDSTLHIVMFYLHSYCKHTEYFVIR